MAKNLTKKSIPLPGVNASAVAYDMGILNFLLNRQKAGGIIFAIAFLFYINTLGHEYTQDDAIVITDNMFTSKGISGIPGILSYDTFYGFFKEEGKANLVSGGRYRPFTLILFAIEFQIFGNNPFIGHLFNILYFAISCFVLYWVLFQIFFKKFEIPTAAFVSFVSALIFAIHPLHTEVVANIKGRDEIMALLLSLTALWALIQYIEFKQIFWLAIGGISYFFALMSKENSITFLAIYPLVFYFFYDFSLLKGFVKSSFFVIPAFLFLAIRFKILGVSLASPSGSELMNNPFIKIVGNQYIPFTLSEKMATIIYTWGRYIKLLIFPHPLTHDYYPRHIDVMDFSKIPVLASILIYGLIAYFSFYFFKKRNPAGFGLLFFGITFSIVSNLFFPIGTNMSERFMFMPSVGYCILVGWGLYRLYSKTSLKPLALGIIVLLFVGYGYKTFSRNFVWVSNSNLFLTDVKTSVNSAKLQNAAGGTLWDLSVLEKDTLKRKEMWKSSKEHLFKALEIHPNYKESHLLLGNVYYAENDFLASISHYDAALKIENTYRDAIRNRGMAYRDYGRFLGEKQGNIKGSLEALLEALKIIPEDFELNRLLGIAYGMSGNAIEAVKYFEKATQIDPKNALAFMNLQIAYKQAGRINEANAAMQKAIQLDPSLKQK